MPGNARIPLCTRLASQQSSVATPQPHAGSPATCFTHWFRTLILISGAPGGYSCVKLEEVLRGLLSSKHPDEALSLQCLLDRTACDGSRTFRISVSHAGHTALFGCGFG